MAAAGSGVPVADEDLVKAILDGDAAAFDALYERRARSNIGELINIALEGFMAVTTFTIVWGSIAFQSIWLGLLVAIVTGMIMSLIHAVATITLAAVCPILWVAPVPQRAETTQRGYLKPWTGAKKRVGGASPRPICASEGSLQGRPCACRARWSGRR